jgi:hypothetical protein
MNVSGTETPQPLTLSEQLDAMLLGWLAWCADRRAPGVRAAEARPW